MRLHTAITLLLSFGSCAAQGFAGQNDQQKPVRIQTDWQIQQTLKISGNRPIYPAIAVLTKVQGVVRLDCILSTQGSPIQLDYLSGPAMLIQAAMDAARSWQFKPTLIDGAPVEVETILPIEFFLSANGSAGYLLPLQKEVQKHPDDAKAREALGGALLAVGEPNQAVLEFREAVRLQPENAGHHFALGNAFAGAGDYESAISEYRTGISISRGDAVAHNNLANFLEKIGDLDGAIGEVREALKFKSREVDSHFHLGTLLAKKGDLDGAIEEFKQAFQDNPTTHFNLGQIFEHKGDLESALKEYKKAVSLCPKCDKYQKTLDRVASSSHK